MSSVVYRYEHNKQFKKNGVGHTIKEKITEGDRGLSFEFTKKEGNNFYRVNVKETTKDMFNIREKKGDIDSTSDKSLADVKKMVSDNKDLTFVKQYIDKERGTYKGKNEESEEVKTKKKSISGGAKKKSKKTSKVVTEKKTSKKSPDKVPSRKKASRRKKNSKA